MHSLPLLFRGFRRGIHLPSVHNGRAALESLQVSPPSEWNISAILHTAWVGIEKSPLGLHLSLSTSASTVFPCPLSPRLSVSGDLRRAVKSTHVSLAGSSIRAELRVTFTHLLRSDILRRTRR
ncbi:hypothetical protein ABG768_012509 [Culter alburnus]|uniref:Uncharacterized protein n=1 Tax=Culter alburnus TaxID=194366 RepID=A0AAW2B131_CULAL